MINNLAALIFSFIPESLYDNPKTVGYIAVALVLLLLILFSLIYNRKE